MPRIPVLDDRASTSRARELILEFEESEGMVTNLIQTLAHSPVALESYLQMSRILAGGELNEKLRFRIALTVSEVNQSPYCLAAYTAYSRAVGLSEREILDARRGESPESRIDAALKFARKLAQNQVAALDTDICRLRKVEYSNGQILEIISVIAMTSYINTINHVAGTELDFQSVPPLNGQ